MSFVCGQSELKTIKTFCPTTSTLEVLDVDQPDFWLNLETTLHKLVFPKH